MIEAIRFEQGSRKVTVTIIIKEIISCLAAHTTWQLSCKHYERAAQLANEASELEKAMKAAFSTEAAKAGEDDE